MIPISKSGARYRVVFRLNDALQSEIQEDIVVQQLYDAQTFGAEFHPSDRYNFELDFHLHPWTVASTSQHKEAVAPKHKPISVTTVTRS